MNAFKNRFFLFGKAALIAAPNGIDPFVERYVGNRLGGIGRENGDRFDAGFFAFFIAFERYKNSENSARPGSLAVCEDIRSNSVLKSRLFFILSSA